MVRFSSRTIDTSNIVANPSIDKGITVTTAGSTGTDPPPNYLEFFQNWCNSLNASLVTTVPSLVDTTSNNNAFGAAFGSACHSLQATELALQAAQQVCLDHPDDQHSQRALETANAAVTQAWETCETVATATLVHLFGDNDRKEPCHNANDMEADLVTYTVLMHGTPSGLADYCNDTNNNAKVVQDFINALQSNGAWLKLVLESGGARNGHYGRAWEIYSCLSLHQQQQQHPPDSSRQRQKQIEQDQHPVLRRLALAVALELADPYPLFNNDTTGDTTNAIQRYLFYEQSYLLGELDTSFSQFNVWELRQVVNSDATEAELNWGRTSLLSYRPDIAVWTDNPQWQYCFIVRSDVDYKDPDFYKSPRSYDQILSGGGKCGPRAWYGRFVCKAFGIPTWGVRQPGHAAMARWTLGQGWTVCLGAGMDVSWWDDQCGSDFMIETRARSACASETEFANAVLHLQWLASFWKEDTSNVRRNGKIDPNNLWTSLGMMQRRRLSAQTTHKLMYPATDTSVGNKLACYREQLLRYHLDTSVLENETASRKNRKAGDDDAIIIPADSCCDPAATTNTVVYMPCFTGGLQLFVKEDASIEFKLPSWVFDFQTSGTNQYYLSCRVATAHRQEQPISLAIGSTVYEIKLPYTMALWGDTDPVLVTCDEYAGNTLRFTRPKQQFGFAILHIRLIPI